MDEETAQYIAIIEALSEYAHNSWSEWMKYLFEKGIYCEDGTFKIDKQYAEKWMKQSTTEYNDLSNEEKDSDRAEAIQIWKVLKKLYSLYN